MAGLTLCPCVAIAQAGPPPSSLMQNPQQGATPRPLPTPAAPAAPIQQAPVRLAPAPPITSIDRAPEMPVLPHGSVLYGPPARQTEGLWKAVPGGLPTPTDDPMKIDAATDPILRLAREETPQPPFRAAIEAAVRHNPALDESIAQRDEAEAVRNEARAREYPVADLAVTGYHTLSRTFSNDPGNVLERSRPRGRTDATLRVQQAVIDFGAIGQRIAAGNDRLTAATAGIEDASAQIALRAIAAWYNVFGYRAMVRLGEAFAESQRDLHERIETRVAQGMAAPGDIAQVDSYIAASDAQLADFRRSLANAEAQYVGIVGVPAPVNLGRAPAPDLRGIAPAGLNKDVAGLPLVRQAKGSADAAGRDAAALKADAHPQLTAGVDAGRYGVLENTSDYDIRANLTLSMRIGGGAKQRIDQALARADGADARYRRTVTEAQRDATIAWSDLAALNDAKHAIEANYMASRRSRDVLVERFRVSRGTLFDVLSAQSNYFGVAARYIQTVTELDTSRYVLLARTGHLLAVLAIDPSTLDAR